MTLPLRPAGAASRPAAPRSVPPQPVQHAPRRPGSATLAQVAARAGVSVSTASKALNGRDDVAEITRERVLASARSLAFRSRGPHPAVDRDADGGIRSIAVVTGEQDPRFATQVARGIETTGPRADRTVVVCHAEPGHRDEVSCLRSLEQRSVDGIVLVGRWSNPRRSVRSLTDLPVVYVYAPSDDAADVSFVADDRGGARLATEHLLWLGRTRIAYLAGAPDHRASADRAAGFEHALADAGLRPAAPIFYGGWRQQWGRQATQLLLAHEPRVDAVFCASDMIAAGVLTSLRERGRSVPDDVAVVGFDDWTPWVEDTSPQLTSVAAGLDRAGRLALDALRAIRVGAGEAGVHRLDPRLVVRGSTVRAER